MVKVKVCGITNAADAVAAAEAGAAFLGFIFYPGSPRAVTAEAVAVIVERLRALPPTPVLVGVFVNQTAEEAAAILDECGLDLAQLSGEEPPAAVADPSSPLFGRAYKAIRPLSLPEGLADAEWYTAPANNDAAPSLLLDAYHPTQRGGTGITADWSVASRLAAAVPRLMLAGGLNPGNVAQAVLTVAPFAVDVASGVEAGPGKKDPALVRAFIAAARSASQP
jgi:phosphoribosylanthranilate isomerase